MDIHNPTTLIEVVVLLTEDRSGGLFEALVRLTKSLGRLELLLHDHSKIHDIGRTLHELVVLFVQHIVCNLTLKGPALLLLLHGRLLFILLLSWGSLVLLLLPILTLSWLIRVVLLLLLLIILLRRRLLLLVLSLWRRTSAGWWALESTTVRWRS